MLLQKTQKKVIFMVIDHEAKTRDGVFVKK